MYSATSLGGPSNASRIGQPSLLRDALNLGKVEFQVIGLDKWGYA